LKQIGVPSTGSPYAVSRFTDEQIGYCPNLGTSGNKWSSGLLVPAREIAETIASADALVDERLGMTQRLRRTQ
jgi:hypothetical protein